MIIHGQSLVIHVQKQKIYGGKEYEEENSQILKFVTKIFHDNSRAIQGKFMFKN